MMDCERPISVLRLSLRTTNCLRAQGVWTIGQLLQVAGRDSVVRRELGRDVSNEIDIALQRHGYAQEVSQPKVVGVRDHKRGTAAVLTERSRKSAAQHLERTVRVPPSRRQVVPSTIVRESDPAPPAAPVANGWQPTKNEVRLYRVRDRWVVRLEVTQKMLRGAGRALPGAVGSAIGCRPGSAMWLFRTRAGGFVVSWPADRPSGPCLGSIYRDLSVLGARERDLVFLEFQGEHASVSLLRADELRRLPASAQVARLVGLLDAPNDQADLWRMVGTAVGMSISQVGVTAEDVHSCLMCRGEASLARLVRQAETKDRSILDDLESILGL